MKKLNTRQKIKISGYWLDTKEKFQGYLCVVNDTTIKGDDDSIFYYFESWADVHNFEKVKGRKDTEFVITKVEEY